MKTLTCIEPGKLDFENRETPSLKKGNAILEIKRVGICGTDLHAYEGTQPYFSYPRVLGHELSGKIAEIDEESAFSIGEDVTIIPYFNCGSCIACRNGKTNCCTQMKVCGVHVDGGLVEYLSVPNSSLIHGQGLGLDDLAIVEPLSIGAHAVRRAAVQPGEFVLVVGAGPIGISIMEFAKLAGAVVIALDTNERRLQFCKQILNVAHFTVKGVLGDMIEQLSVITNGDMPTVIMDATGNLKAINNGFSYMAHGGRYVLVGLQKGDISFSHPDFHKKEGSLSSSRNATKDDFDFVISNIKNGKINPGTYITHRVNFEEVPMEFNKWLNRANNVIKAMVEMK